MKILNLDKLRSLSRAISQPRAKTVTREEAERFCKKRALTDPVDALIEWVKTNPGGVVTSQINMDGLMFKAYEEGYAHAKADYGPDCRPMVMRDDRFPKAAFAEKEAVERVIEAEVNKRMTAFATGGWLSRPDAEERADRLIAKANATLIERERVALVNAETVDRLHHALARHGWHPGRTGEPIADCLERALEAGPAGPYPNKRSKRTD